MKTKQSKAKPQYNKRSVSKKQIRKLVNMQKAKADRAADKFMDLLESWR